MDPEIMKLVEKGKVQIQKKLSMEEDKWIASMVDYNARVDAVEQELAAILPDEVLPYFTSAIARPPVTPDWKWMDEHKNMLPPMQVGGTISIPDFTVINISFTKNQYKEGQPYECGFNFYGVNGIEYQRTIEEALYLAFEDYKKACEVPF
jgi:hypothetical protein